ncbi:WG repeat-containing protein [Psychrobacter sp. BI730]|uniref:WG repeat-containing protein n=1 Tax=Psychrobacter sp. BI730 TaxID=2705463 RepID=UPI0015CAE0B3|nr:WG repeat-containing protein [Psychrobacter sp. BI730]NYR10867.1 WG repeat-containing protein [Psychrobacter sp. BI730]
MSRLRWLVSSSVITLSILTIASQSSASETSHNCAPKYKDLQETEGLYILEDLVEVERNGKYGFINKNGQNVIPIEYDSIHPEFSEGLLGVEKEGKYGFVNKNGKEVIPIEYDYVGYFSEDLAAVGREGRSGFIDKQGEVVIPIEYDDINRPLAKVIS